MKRQGELQRLAAGTAGAAEVERIKAAWAALLLSPAPDHSLRRYIRFQQQQLRELAGLPAAALAAQQLQAFLQQYFSDYTGPAPGAAKLGLNLTVAQLALLARLLGDEGVFVPISVTALLRFFSAHFSSKRQAAMSEGSLNKLYYSSDQFTAATVRGLLVNMAARLNQQYFTL